MTGFREQECQRGLYQRAVKKAGGGRYLRHARDWRDHKCRYVPGKLVPHVLPLRQSSPKGQIHYGNAAKSWGGAIGQVPIHLDIPMPIPVKGKTPNFVVNRRRGDCWRKLFYGKRTPICPMSRLRKGWRKRDWILRAKKIDLPFQKSLSIVDWSSTALSLGEVVYKGSMKPSYQKRSFLKSTIYFKSGESPEKIFFWRWKPSFEDVCQVFGMWYTLHRIYRKGKRGYIITRTDEKAAKRTGAPKSSMKSSWTCWAIIP